MSKDFITAMKTRRSVYSLTKESPLPNDQIVSLVQEVLLHVPSAFNSQSQKAVVLFGAHHDKLWDFFMNALKKIVPPEKFSSTEEKILSFKAGYGTVLYFDDTSITQDLADKFAPYKDNFPIWAQQSNGMLQFAVWSLLAQEGLGASLQHYNPLADEEIHREWNIPAEWKLIAQMPFGKPGTGALGEKTFAPLETRLKIFE